VFCPLKVNVFNRTNTDNVIDAPLCSALGCLSNNFFLIEGEKTTTVHNTRHFEADRHSRTCVVFRTGARLRKLLHWSVDTTGIPKLASIF